MGMFRTIVLAGRMMDKVHHRRAGVCTADHSGKISLDQGWHYGADWFQPMAPDEEANVPCHVAAIGSGEHDVQAVCT